MWATAAAALVLLVPAVACGGASNTTYPKHPDVPSVPRVLRVLRTHMQPERFEVVHRSTDGTTNIAPKGSMYGSFLIEIAPGSVVGHTWGPENVKITKVGRSGNFSSYGDGVTGGVADYVKAYGDHVFAVWYVDVLTKDDAKTIMPGGPDWALLDKTLSDAFAK